MISYVEVVVKKRTNFTQSVMYDVYKPKYLKKKNRSVEKDSIRFRVKVTIELGFDFKTFFIGNREHKLIHV